MSSYCFVCCGEDGVLRRACRCDTWVHAACLDKVVASVPSHRTRCPVCRDVYATAWRFEWTWTSARVVCAWLFVATTCTFACAASAAVVASRVYSAVPVVLIATVLWFGAMLSFLVSLHVYLHAQRRTVCCFRRVVVAR